jgi:hypothetical protein
MMFAQLVTSLRVFLCIDILYCHIETLILIVELRNHSVNGSVSLKVAENINQLNVHSVALLTLIVWDAASILYTYIITVLVLIKF